jgi:predicted house-cleaning noncanonical NTP pyrophosphatase (MazG superfamily)
VTLRFRVEKLIRDGVPAMMRAQGLRVFERQLDADDFIAELKRKLVEEAAEAAASSSLDELLEELADLQEVIMALTGATGSSMAAVEAIRLAKSSERGGFAARIYNAAVEAEPSCPAAAYYLARPEQYPQLGDQDGATVAPAGSR